nr:OmpA family protein [Pontibaca salina]
MATFALAAFLSLVTARLALTAIEQTTEIDVRRALDESSFGWAEVQANGLQVILTGTAPDEARRFAALSAVARAVDAARLVDSIEIAPSADLTPPRFSAEILRNDSGISIIGLIPTASDRKALIHRLNRMVGAENVADLLETANYPAPQGWNQSLDFAITALARLPRSKVSVDAGRISVTAIANSTDEKTSIEADLTRSVPRGIDLSLEVAAPRPVITPFTLRFLIDDKGARFDACSAETENSAHRILKAAQAAGLEKDDEDCTVGMGVPSPRWAEAAELTIGALAELGQGSVTFADADISLVAAETTEPKSFERVIGELEAALPEVFALNAVLTKPESETPNGPAEFVATLSATGQAQLRGRLSDNNLRQVADSYARASFGSQNVYTATRQVDDLPRDWPARVLAGLEALSKLAEGSVTVKPDTLIVRGISERKNANAEISGLVVDKLGEAESFELDITYRAPPKPKNAAPTPEECQQQLAKIQKGGKITFEPGSAKITGSSRQTMSAIVKILDRCGEIPLEIQGHTDSQGREEMNQQLSQRRADAVLAELRARRVLTSTYKAVGYGITKPIADNGTAEGREANRRIEFRLIHSDADSDEENSADAAPHESGDGSNGQEKASAPDASDKSDAKSEKESEQ